VAEPSGSVQAVEHPPEVRENESEEQQQHLPVAECRCERREPVPAFATHARRGRGDCFTAVWTKPLHFL